MEDHHQYGMADLRQYMNGGGRPIFGSIQAAAAVLPSELIPATAHQQQQQQQQQLNRTNLGPGHHHQYEMVMGSMTQVPSSSSSAHGLTTHHHHHQHQHQHQHEFLTDSSPVGAATTSAGFSGMDQMETGGGGCVGGGGDGSGRWPRQETLTLLEIRSRLDSKFKEANQKGPLWDEISRIMCEEHGYQRTGKKCREKFENLYKYYKKTKEGKAGRQDGKHYRFFRQLEALYGETSNNISASGSEALHLGSHFPYNPVNSNNFQHQQQQAPTLSDSPSLISSSEFNTTSSDQDSDQEYKTMGKKRRGKRSLKAKIKDFIDEQMRKLMEKQEAWLEKMMKMIEHKEQERISREEEWRNQETIRMEREHKFWANERAWIEARDASLMEAVHKLSGKDLMINSTSISSNPRYHDPDVEDIVDIRGLKDGVDQHWSESEITRLIQLRTSMESRFQQLGDDDDDDDHILWEEIGAKMTILGYEKSGTMCKNKWSNIINTYLIKCNKKRKDQNTTTSLSSCYNNNSNHHVQINNQYYEADGSSCFRYLMGDHAHQQQNLWENYELKLTKGGGDGDGDGGGGGNN